MCDLQKCKIIHLCGFKPLIVAICYGSNRKQIQRETVGWREDTVFWYKKTARVVQELSAHFEIQPGLDHSSKAHPRACMQGKEASQQEALG